MVGAEDCESVSMTASMLVFEVAGRNRRILHFFVNQFEDAKELPGTKKLRLEIGLVIHGALMILGTCHHLRVTNPSRVASLAEFGRCDDGSPFLGSCLVVDEVLFRLLHV